MATITEDYVSYEIAKLLKEKGFDEKVSTHYLVHPSGFSEFFDKKDEFPEPEDVWLKCPTHQMAMKWLREVHHLYINVGFGNDYKGEFLYMGDIYDLTKDAIHAKYEPIIEADDYLSDNPKTYEEACEAAIKYALKYLI